MRPGAFFIEFGATLRLAWPLVITNLAQTAMTATDVLMMGRIGPEAVAAGALGSNLSFALVIFGIGLMSAAAPMMAVELGRNRFSVRDLRRTFRQGLWSAVAIVIPMWAILWHGEMLLLWLRQEPSLAREGGIYLRHLQWGMLPFFLYLVLRSFFAAMQRPGMGMMAACFAFVFNIFANWVLMWGNLGVAPMGLAGSGLATTLSSTVMFLALVVAVFMDRRFRRYHLFGRFWRADWKRWREFWRIGLPIGATLVFEVSIFNAAVFLMGIIGQTALAAHAIAIQIASLTFMVPMGIAQAVTVRVGLCFGSRDRDGIALAGLAGFVLAEGFMVFTALVMILAPQMLISAFLNLSDPANAQVIVLAVSYLAVAALFQLVDGAQVIGAGMLRGLHDTHVPMVYALVGYWIIALPLAVALGFWTELSGLGIWLGLAVGLAIVAWLMLSRWLRREQLGLLNSLN